VQHLPPRWRCCSALLFGCDFSCQALTHRPPPLQLFGVALRREAVRVYLLSQSLKLFAQSTLFGVGLQPPLLDQPVQGSR